MAAREELIGFDLGTSAVKAVLADTAGNVLGVSSRPVPIIRPKPRHCEIDPSAYFDDIVSTIRDLAGASEDPSRIRAVSFCAASGNAILLDESYAPVGNAISWLDTRSANEADELWPELDAQHIHRLVGWPWSGRFPLAQLAWLKRFEPERWAAATYFAMNNDYVYHRLCGKLVVDPSKATTFFLQDQEAQSWDPALLEFLGISETDIPEIVPSGTSVGTILPQIAEATGLNADTHVVTGSFDHPSAARGTGVFEQGDLLISAGTSWVAFAPLLSRSAALDNAMLVDPFMRPEGCWGTMFALTEVADRIDSLLEHRFGRRDDLYRIFDDLALQSDVGSGGLLIDPWTQTVEEVSAATETVPDSDYARALMEGCALLMRNRIETLRTIIGGDMNRLVMVGGPTKSPIWPQILANVLGHTIRIPTTGAHAGALGAAILAGVGAGIFSGPREGQASMRSMEEVINPEPQAVNTYEALYGAFRTRFGLP